MSFANPPGRPAKVARTCFLCKANCLPKNGDWFTPAALKDKQVFLCKSCERGSMADYQRVAPVRF